MLSIVLSALLPACLIGLLFYLLDKHKEPLIICLRAFFFGILSVGLLILLELFLPHPTATTHLQEVLWRAFYEASFKEEVAKFVMLLWAVYRHRHFDEWYDGLLYGVLIGLGFAFIENIKYFSDFLAEQGGSLVVARSILSMPVHALCGGIMGYYVGKAKFTLREGRVGLYFILALVVPIFIHGLFDFFVFYSDAGIKLLTVPLVLYMWIKTLKLKKESQANAIF